MVMIKKKKRSKEKFKNNFRITLLSQPNGIDETRKIIFLRD